MRSLPITVLLEVTLIAVTVLRWDTAVHTYPYSSGRQTLELPRISEIGAVLTGCVYFSQDPAQDCYSSGRVRLASLKASKKGQPAQESLAHRMDPRRKALAAKGPNYRARG